MIDLFLWNTIYHVGKVLSNQAKEDLGVIPKLEYMGQIAEDGEK